MQARVKHRDRRDGGLDRAIRVPAGVGAGTQEAAKSKRVEQLRF